MKKKRKNRAPLSIGWCFEREYGVVFLGLLDKTSFRMSLMQQKMKVIDSMVYLYKYIIDILFLWININK